MCYAGLDGGILVGTSPATSVDTASCFSTGIGCNVELHASTTGTLDLSVLGESFEPYSSGCLG